MAKFIRCVVFLLAAVAFTHGLPAESRTEESKPDDDVDIFNGGFRQPVVVVPTFFSFDGISKSINDMFNRMRQQMSSVLAFPSRFGSGEPGNTTSITKVINGHKYTINETVYEKGDGNSEAFFKVRIVDIHPVDDEKGSTTARSKDVEEIENSDENDVNKSFQKREQPFGGLESFDEVDHPIKIDLSNDIYVNEMAAKDMKPNPESEWFGDLTNDIRVNEIAAAQGWKPNPDAETFPVYNTVNKLGSIPTRSTEWSIEDLDEGNTQNGEREREYIEEVDRNGDVEVLENDWNHASEIEAFEPIVEMRGMDLSRDTLVNELLQDETPVEDAEVLNSPQSRYFYTSALQR